METMEALAACIKTFHSLDSTIAWAPHRAALRCAKAGECLRRKETGKAAALSRCAYTAAKITVRIMCEFVYAALSHNCKRNKPLDQLKFYQSQPQAMSR